ncbi:hypothetical protein DP130_01870 [Clostridium tetani]|uniref:Uncharacterized protein n=1 Tax=Clostridium tetani TaxID=1513 RepID=A0A4V1LF26_CLOTA|nr:hypothetical protein DP130_01870 [Clostridium tetani]
MILKIKINTKIEINSVKDLGKLKILVEVNNLDKPPLFNDCGRQTYFHFTSEVLFFLRIAKSFFEPQV